MRTHLLTFAVLTGVALTSAGCQKASTDNKSRTGSGSSAVADKGSGAPGFAPRTPPAVPAAPAAPAKDIDSKEILARTETAPEVQVKHVLIGWKDLAGAYHGHMDPRANRSNDDAAKLAQGILAKLKADPDQIGPLSKEQSEDPGSQTGDPYTVKADSPFVPEFKNLSLRLKVKEAGIVKTNFGYHVIERVLPPPPDPLETRDILDRKPTSDATVQVQFVLISWKDTPLARSGNDPRAAKREKAEADKIAKDVFDKLKKGGDIKALATQFSEEPAPNKPGKIYDIQSASGDEPFRDLALRLKVNEVGMAKTQYGWLVVKHVPPPPPDSLESADILKRDPQTQSAEVKHILLGWADVNSNDDRAKKRDRATLEKLVKDTVAKLQKGDKIEPLMAELSEDPGSAKDGKSYPVTPDAGLVPSFKNLSLRLKVGEVGVVKSDFGIHIIERIK